MICNQICPYNTYDECDVEEKNGVCPKKQAVGLMVLLLTE